MELILKHKNGKKSTLIPISFDYNVIYYDQPEYDDMGWIVGYKTDHYKHVDISQLWRVIGKSTPLEQVDFNDFHCKIKSKKQCKYLFEIFENLMDYTKMPLKSEIVSEGEMIFTNKSIKALGATNTVNKIKYIFHCCIPTGLEDNKIFNIKSDYIEMHI